MSDEDETTPGNPDQEKYWNSVSGQKWLDFQNELDALMKSVSDRLLQRADIVAGQKILDIGCGTGATTRHAASLAGPNGIALGADISALMLDRARSNKSGVDDAATEFILADAQTHNFGSEKFDHMVSRFGVMFFDSPVMAFKNLAGALRPGGKMSFACWSDFSANPWFSIPRDVAVSQLGKPAPTSPTAPGPTAFADTERVLNILKQAGLRSCHADVEQLDLVYPGGAAEAAHLASRVGPAIRVINEFNGTSSDMDQIERNVNIELAKFVKGDKVHVPARINFFEATV